MSLKRKRQGGEMKGGFKFTDPAVSAASAKVQQLVSHAQQCMQRYELDAALKFYEKVCAAHLQAASSL